MRVRAVIWVLALALLPPCADVAGQGRLDAGGGQPVEVLREQAEALERNIREHESDLTRFTRQEHKLLKDLEASDLTLQRHRRRAAVLKAELEDLDQKIESTQATIADVTRRIRAGETAFARRLVALYKASWFGTAPVLATAGSVADLVQRRNALTRILAHDRQARESLLVHQTELARLQSRLLAHQQKKRAGMGEYTRLITAAGDETARRKRLFVMVQAQRETQQAAIADLKQSAEELSRKIESLRRAPPPRPPDGSPARQGLFNIERLAYPSGWR